MTAVQLCLGLAILLERCGVIIFDHASPGGRLGFVQVRWFWPLTVLEVALTAVFLIPHWVVAASWVVASFIVNALTWRWLIASSAELANGAKSGNRPTSLFGRSYLGTLLFRCIHNVDLLVLAVIVDALERSAR